VLVDGKGLPGCSLIQEYINDLLKYPNLYHSHVWDLNDIAIYDNYSFIHGRTPIVFNNDPDNNERTFYRTNVDHMTDEEFQNVELPSGVSTSTIK
jgi:alpha-ketoglutarate-dependent taurine dioxygenase